MKFFTLKERPFFHDPNGTKLLTNLRLNFSYLNEDKLHHYFNDTVVPMRDYDNQTETTEHFFLQCLFL